MRLLLAILSIVGTFLLVESRTFPLLGGYQAQTQINDNVIELAKWAAINLPQYTKVNGEYSVLTIRDLRTQVVSGINYKFTIDVLLGTPENKYFVSKLIICSINDNLFIYYICKYSFIHVMLLYMINHGLK